MSVLSKPKQTVNFKTWWFDKKNFFIGNQYVTEEVKRVKLSSSKLNGKEEQLTKLNVRNFNMDGMGKFQNENFKKENK